MIQKKVPYTSYINEGPTKQTSKPHKLGYRGKFIEQSIYKVVDRAWRVKGEGCSMGRTVTTHGGNAERAGRGMWLWVRTTEQEESLGSECPYRSLLLPQSLAPYSPSPTQSQRTGNPSVKSTPVSLQGQSEVVKPGKKLKRQGVARS